MAKLKKYIFLSQKKYVLHLLKETSMLGCKAAKTPIEVNHKVKTIIEEAVNMERYQRLDGKINYRRPHMP